jgi:hypothetical protein
MKNKKMLYVLLPAVVLIWGMIAYRIVQSLEGEILVKPASGSRHDKIEEQTTDESYVLLTDYPDPFLSNPIKKSKDRIFPFPQAPMPQQSRSISATPVHSPSPLVVPPVTVHWPEVAYLGVIENKAKKTKVALLKVAGQEVLLRAGALHQGVRVTSIFRDSIGLAFQGEGRTVRKVD